MLCKVYTTVLTYISSHILKAMKTKGKVEKPFEKLENFVSGWNSLGGGSEHIKILNVWRDTIL